MKKVLRSIKLLALIVLATTFAACDVSGSVVKDISGTEWVNEPVIAGSGTGLVFTSTNSGHQETGVLGAWITGTSFSYQYNEFNKTGTISINSSSSNFSITDNKLTYSSTVYTKK
jgi:uncharacterized membrane protein